MPVFLGLGAKLLGISSAVHSAAKRVPWQVWVGLLVVVLVVVGVIAHGHAKASFGQERFNDGYAKGVADAKAAALKASRAVETKGRDMAQDERTKNDAKTASIEHDARVVFVRGPGHAACAPVAPAAADNPAPAGQGNAPLPAVPAGAGQQLIGLPIDAAVGFAKQNDQALADNASWWSWYDRYSAIITDYQRQIAALQAKQGGKK